MQNCLGRWNSKCEGLGCCRVEVMGMERRHMAVVQGELPTVVTGTIRADVTQQLIDTSLITSQERGV